MLFLAACSVAPNPSDPPPVPAHFNAPEVRSISRRAVQGSLAIDGSPAEMFLDGDTAVVFSNGSETTYPTVLDVSTLSNMKVPGRYEVPGSYRSARRIGKSVRLVAGMTAVVERVNGQLAKALMAGTSSTGSRTAKSGPGPPRPSRSPVSESMRKELSRERALIEGGIGAVKSSRYNFNRPRAKSTRMMGVSGQLAVLGFNLNKLARAFATQRKMAVVG